MTPANTLVLLVEDNATDVVLIKRAFDQAKMANPIHVISDGDTAVAYLNGDGVYADRTTHPLPILILLDLKLPRRSGLEVLEWLKTQPDSLRRIPVVMLTSSEQPSDVDAAYDNGVNSYLVKPVEYDSLFKMLKAVNLYWMMLNERPRLHDAG